MFSAAELHLAYKIGNVPFSQFPFPHFYLNDVFPADYYRQLLQNLPDPAAMRPIEEVRAIKGYKERFVLGLDPQSIATLPENKRAFWLEFAGWFLSGRLRALVMRRFETFISQRLAGRTGFEFYDEALLVQDVTNYKLGPHTDALHKVVTVLFYLPPDDSQRHLGTSIYLPNDPKFRCQGGPHHRRENFSLLHTNPFLPNSMFAFFKTDNSFHGVEPVADPDCRRWLLLYDIYAKQSAPGAQEQPAAAAAEPSPKVKFSF